VSATTSLFTDIVGSTEKAVELGHGAWADLLERHHAAVRAEIARCGGQAMDTSGDGFFVIFRDPAKALASAAGIRTSVEALGLQIGIGMHVGDCWVADDKCTGLAIHIGARIAGLARPGEILVSQPLKAAVADASYRFADRGKTELKGVPGHWHLYALLSAD
jgi:class 3 adenylate cyclase